MTKTKLNWEVWDVPEIEELFVLAKTIAKYVKFLDPKIVKCLVDQNEKDQNLIRVRLMNVGISESVYCWEQNPVAFPGIRRFAGKKEDKLIYKRNSLSAEIRKDVLQAIILDGNSWPKHVWSYALGRNKPFTTRGPDEYQMAHLIDHKDYSLKRLKEELVGEFPVGIPHAFAGLFSSVANTCFVSSNFLGATDHNKLVRRMLQYRAEQLYSEVCEMLPFGLRLKEVPNDWKKAFEQIAWTDPIGDAHYLDAFFEYRETEMRKLFGK
jgi:hypothetical protein